MTFTSVPVQSQSPPHHHFFVPSKEINLCRCSECQRDRENNRDLHHEEPANMEKETGEEEINYSICKTLRIICTEYFGGSRKPREHTVWSIN